MVSRAVVINAGYGKVFSEISNLQNWKHWQPVFMNDSSQINFKTDSNGMSNYCEWDSKGKKKLTPSQQRGLLDRLQGFSTKFNK